MMLALSAPAQVLTTATYPVTGHPYEALSTPDGRYVLVTVTRQAPVKLSGIDVFAVTGQTLHRVAFQELGTEGAQGILLIPKTRMLAVGMSNAGVAFLPLDDAIAGKAKVQVLAQGEHPATANLAATPDGKTLFAANEAGDGGNVAVIALHTDVHGEVHPETVARLPALRSSPGLALSTDGTRLYAEGEVVAAAELVATLPGHDNPELAKQTCLPGGAGKPRPNGVLYVWDAAKAAAGDSNSQLAAVNAGCAPVREALTANGATVYVTARDDNKVMVFDARGLETNAKHALLRAIPTGGVAPVGLKLFDRDRRMLVANSNRSQAAPGNAVVFDLSNPAKPKLVQTIETGLYPRNIAVSADGETLYLTVFNADELMVLRVAKR
jgi:DNA-binding beta-propeller fold protein YncE